MFDDAVIIYEYTLQQAIEDGVLFEILKADWPSLTQGKPIVATSSIYYNIPIRILKMLWNEFVEERTQQLERGEVPCLRTTYKGERIWILEDGQAITYLYPHEY